MRVMVMVKATESSESGQMPDEKLMGEMGKFNEELANSGIMKAGEGLKPSSQGARVRFSGKNRIVTDGPFAETKELVAGYWLWEVPSLEEAIQWVKRCPNPMVEDSDIEIRPLYEMEDFAECAPTGELMEEEKHLREALDDQPHDAERDRGQILSSMAKWRDALENKDVDAMMQDYAIDAVLYDACPPYKTEGVEGIRQVWEKCLRYFPDEFKSEHRDVQIHVDGDVAFVHGVHHFVPTPVDHPCGQTWMRVSIGYRRVMSQWKVVHEHVSIPFNPLTKEAWYITEPEKLEMPDYATGTE